MLWRKIEEKLERFRALNGKKALLLTGARQVGKTYSIRQFAKRHYKSFVEINFIRDTVAKDIFEKAADAKDVLLRLSAFAKGKFKRGKTLVFLDEVQRCPEAVTFVKFLVEDGGCHYILSGSLLGVELKNVRSVPVGYMYEETMYPLDFEEFLIANGIGRDVMNHLADAFDATRPVDSAIHDLIIRYYRLYIVVGGMPEAVQRYVDTNDLAEVMSVQKAIRVEYHRDISQYTAAESLRIREVYDRIPSELNKPNKRFTLRNVVKGSHFDRIEDGFIWLRDAGVAHPVCCVDEPKAPLELSSRRNLFKLFANDVGLLSSMFMDGIQLRILNGERNVNFGAVYENAVAQELVAHGFRVRYFNSKRHGELDFVVERDGVAVPIEVKSGKNYKRHSALSSVMACGEYGIGQAYVLNNDNVSKDGKIIYLPIYMSMFLRPADIPEKMIYTIDTARQSTERNEY